MVHLNLSTHGWNSLDAEMHFFNTTRLSSTYMELILITLMYQKYVSSREIVSDSNLVSAEAIYKMTRIGLETKTLDWTIPTFKAYLPYFIHFSGTLIHQSMTFLLVPIFSSIEIDPVYFFNSTLIVTSTPHNFQLTINCCMLQAD